MAVVLRTIGFQDGGKIVKLNCQLAIPKLMSGLGTSVKKCPN
jgi:hypothetical protein